MSLHMDMDTYVICVQVEDREFIHYIHIWCLRLYLAYIDI